MNQGKVEQFLALVGGEVRSISSSDWVMSPCPFAPWTHSSGKDSNPSFGIKINADGPSGYNCFSCGRKGDNLVLMLIDLAGLREHDPELGHWYDLKTANKLAEKYEIDTVDTDEIPDYEYKGRDKEKQVIFPHDWLMSFPGVLKFTAAKEYLRERKVKFSDAQKLRMRFDPSRKMVCLPIMGDKGCIGMVGRSIVDNVSGGLKHHDYSYFGRRNGNAIMNEGCIDWDEPVIVVEGMFDFLRVYSLYENVLGLKGVSLNSKRLKKLGRAMELYTFLDSDDAGSAARATLSKRLGGIIVEQFIPSSIHPYAKDVDDIPKAKLHQTLSEYVRIDKWKTQNGY